MFFNDLGLFGQLLLWVAEESETTILRKVRRSHKSRHAPSPEAKGKAVEDTNLRRR